MANVGSVHIAGSIDVSSIKHGLGEMKNSLKGMKDSAEGSFGDISRLAGGLGGVAISLAKIGIGLVATTLGIAALSPQVAPELAKMEIAFAKLTRILGAELKPVFAEFARMFTGFVEWLGTDGRPVLEFLKDVLLALMSDFDILATNAGKAYKEVKFLMDLFDKDRDKPPVPEKVTVNGQEVYLTEQDKGNFELASTAIGAAQSLAGLGSGVFESQGPRGTIPAMVMNAFEASAMTMQNMLDEIGSGNVNTKGWSLNSLMDRYFKNYEEATPGYESMRFKNYG